MIPIPNPVLKPYSGRKSPDLKPLVQVTPPAPQPAAEKKKPSGNNPETKPETKPAAPVGNPLKLQQKPEIPGNHPEIKKQELPGKLGQTAEGVVIPTPLQPVDPLFAMASSNPTLAMTMLRQLKDMEGPMPNTSIGALALMEKVETRLKNGEDISVLNDEISMHLMGDDEHNELIMRLNASLDRERMMEIFKSRSKWEDFCHACMRRGELSVLDGMALIPYWNNQLVNIFDRIQRKQSKTDGSGIRESADLVERVNRPTLLQNKHFQVKFDDAPPQEREILRKLMFKLERDLVKITTTTTTETKTVELRNPEEEKPVHDV